MSARPEGQKDSVKFGVPSEGWWQISTLANTKGIQHLPLITSPPPPSLSFCSSQCRLYVVLDVLPAHLAALCVLGRGTPCSVLEAVCEV